MNKLVVCLFLLISLMWVSLPAKAQNPFLSKNSPELVSRSPSSPNSFLVKIALWQQHLKEKMAVLIRQARTAERITPLITVLMIALGYGALHAAGPGHGKAVAMSYILSQNAAIGSGVLFGVLVAFFHGFSGALCVFGLHFILQKGVAASLGTISHITQIVSFSLITLLGIGILLKNLFELFGKNAPRSINAGRDPVDSRKAFFPLALSVGLVPCPGVVMVLLFCLSMNMLGFGLLLAAFISLGMAMTISLVIVAVIIGKNKSKKLFPESWAANLECVIGVFSGTVLLILGTLFLLSVV